MALISELYEPSYPIGSINTGLYTAGGEYSPYFSVNDDYVGLYHELPNGELWTEAIPVYGTSFRLIKKTMTFSNDVAAYLKLKQQTASQYIGPTSYKPIVTSNDIARGSITRYFLQKFISPEYTIIEVDGPQYQSVNTDNIKGINGRVWNKCIIQWSINALYAYDVNKSTVEKTERNFPGILKYLSDYLEMSK